MLASIQNRDGRLVSKGLWDVSLANLLGSVVHGGWGENYIHWGIWFCYCSCQLCVFVSLFWIFSANAVKLERKRNWDYCPFLSSLLLFHQSSPSLCLRWKSKWTDINEGFEQTYLIDLWSELFRLTKNIYEINNWQSKHES